MSFPRQNEYDNASMLSYINVDKKLRFSGHKESDRNHCFCIISIK